MASQLRPNGFGSGGTDGYSGGPLDWWNQIHGSKQWESGIFYTLCACYALVSMVALTLKFHRSELLAAAILQALTAHQLFLAPPQLTATSVPSVAIASPVPHFTGKQNKPCTFCGILGSSWDQCSKHLRNLSAKGVSKTPAASPPLSFVLSIADLEAFINQVLSHTSSYVMSVTQVRAVLFGLYRSVLHVRPKVSFFLLIPLVQSRLLLQSKIMIPMLTEAVTLEMMLMDIPGLLFFSTYTLLVLFWAEIYHQARSLPVDKLRPAYFIINGLTYFIQVCIWIYMRLTESSAAIEVAKLFFSVVSFCAALGFVIYGGRLFIMLQHFPIESRGRQKKLHEQESSLWTLSIAGWLCYGNLLYLLPDKMYYGEFLVGLSAFDEDVDVDVLDHPILDLIYYMVVEIFPSALVLFILRKLPPKRVSDQYHPIK
ncbi:hypothetical protein RJ640_009020 [Escallonia rubra]|uniref:THH1/TOM1/TOM3 domain-containing protein n=1 Tax=Escallonia rubra TaxID=112253 RepID=A0AA88R4K3_9ASTE|nr:hypothetical protein RJ640_009020 [Escallonia rubra]